MNYPSSESTSFTGGTCPRDRYSVGGTAEWLLAAVGDGELNPDKTIPKWVCNLSDSCTLSICPLASPHDFPQAPTSSSPNPSTVIPEEFASWRTILEDGVTEHSQELEGLAAGAMKTKHP